MTKAIIVDSNIQSREVIESHLKNIENKRYLCYNVQNNIKISCIGVNYASIFKIKRAITRT